MELGLRDPEELYEIDPIVLGFYRAGMTRRLERESKLAFGRTLRGFF